MRLRCGCWFVWLALCLAGSVAAADPARPAQPNLARGALVRFDTPPNYPATNDAADPQQLVDGQLSSGQPIWYDRSIVGWVFCDPTVFTIDLGRDQALCGVGVHLAAGQAGVEWPQSVEVYLSTDGQRWAHRGNLAAAALVPPPAAGYAAHWLATDRWRTHARYVRLVLAPVNRGNGAYLMLDEVEVYQGEAAWLGQPLALPPPLTDWSAAWTTLTWQAQPDLVPAAERPRALVWLDPDPRPAPPPAAVDSTAEGRGFTLRGEPGEVRSLVWTARLATPVALDECRHAVLTFRASGLRRRPGSHALLTLRGVNNRGPQHQIALLDGNAAPSDGRWHTLYQPLPAGFNLQSLEVGLTTWSSTARLDIARLRLSATPPTDLLLAAGPARPRPGWLPVELGPALNSNLTAWSQRCLGQQGALLDGVLELAPGALTVCEVPFRVAAGDANLAVLPETPEPSAPVTFLGQTVQSRDLGPQSRDDSLSVPLDAVAREAVLLLAVAAPLTQVRGGLPPTALRLDDPECLRVELAYDRGPADVAFPYSLADAATVVPARGLGAYAVAVDPTRRLRRLTLRSQQYRLNFALAALTLNTTDRPLVPELLPPAPAPLAVRPVPPAQAPQVSATTDRLTLRNRWYGLDFGLAAGFGLDRLVHRGNPAAAVRVAPGSGLLVRLGDRLYTGRCFTARVLTRAGATVTVELTSRRPELPLRLTLKLTVLDSPELRCEVTATNLGPTPLAPSIAPLALHRLQLGPSADTRLFFPQYRNVDTADQVALRAPYGPEFAGQFMDVYQPAAGIGLMWRTANAAQEMADFTLRKDTAVDGAVWFPQEIRPLLPGQPRALPAVSLLAHPGDWHTALALYRDWLRHWYQSQQAQDKPWFVGAWEMQVYRPSEKVSQRETRVPGFCAPDKQRCFIAETFEFEQRRLGHVPDLIHFFNWTYDDQHDRDTYGVHGTALAYQQVGGLERWRQAIATIQQQYGRPVSLYTLPDRFRASALPSVELARELTAGITTKALDNDPSEALRAAGVREGIYYPGLGHRRWAEFFVDDIARMQRETGCQMVYLDVFPRFSQLRGAPGVSPRDDDLDLLRRVRAALPASVAVWTEYPFTDVATQAADGCVQYYFQDLHEAFARRYDSPDTPPGALLEAPLNVSRFALPYYRTFLLPVYLEASNRPSCVDAALFNGEPFHEDTFRLHHSRLRDRLNRAYLLKHRYADCFGSAAPEPWVTTAAAGILANRFPGRGRTVWTVWNRRPQTYRGVVLRLPHRAGATYHDLWHDQPLQPTIRQGVAELRLSLDPQEVGAVAQQ
ncbi:MAG: hypothetical protein IT204_08820 [Fimbriimonadaceae bacterium]|nr:hypothetical protein [Fimbriimonadaceae bacterium]